MTVVIVLCIAGVLATLLTGGTLIWNGRSDRLEKPDYKHIADMERELGMSVGPPELPKGETKTYYSRSLVARHPSTEAFPVQINDTTYYAYAPSQELYQHDPVAADRYVEEQLDSFYEHAARKITFTTSKYGR